MHGPLYFPAETDQRLSISPRFTVQSGGRG